MKRVRPPMPPLAVRVKVAERQVRKIHPFAFSVYQGIGFSSDGAKLKSLLLVLFTDLDMEKIPYALDHDPALVLRKYNPRIKDIPARYTPHAHDPDALIYREKADHQQKTTGRKPGATHTATTLGSDIHLKTKFARLEGRTKPKRKAPIKSRGFAKGPSQSWPKRKMR